MKEFQLAFGLPLLVLPLQLRFRTVARLDIIGSAARPRDRSGLYGDWFPMSSTAGVVGMETNNDVLLEQTGYFRNKNGLLEQWGQAEADTGTLIVTFPVAFSQLFSLTLTPSNPDGNLTYAANIRFVTNSA